MFNVCPACGIYSVEKEILPGPGWTALAVCPNCRHTHPFLRLPLLAVTGASGSGKTALGLVLTARDRRFIHLETDILWRDEFNSPENDYRTYREMWLRLAKNIAQAGRPVILYGSITTGQIEPCLERRYFSHVHMLALVCEDDILAQRLRLRSAWRGAGSDAFSQDMLGFNRWFRAHGPDENIELFDTSRASLEETASEALRWAARCWDGPTEIGDAYG